MSKQEFTPGTGVVQAPSPKGAILLAAVVVVVFALVVARFTVLAGHGGTEATGVGSALGQAAPFPMATPLSGQTNQASTGKVVTGSTPIPLGIVPGYPRPDIDSAYEQSLRASIGNPDKVIMVSLTGQYIRAYDHGKLVKWAYVTTGKAGLETPTGVFHIGWKLSPFTFEPLSTDPHNTLYFGYPSKVQYAMEFADGGYYIHDTWWRTVYGPGLTMPHWDPGRLEGSDGSHGCVNTPLEMMTWLWNWAPVNTPVIVYQN